MKEDVVQVAAALQLPVVVVVRLNFSLPKGTNTIIIIIFIYSVFPISVSGWFFTNSSDSKSHQVSRTILSILAVLSKVVVWIVSNHPPTSKSSSSFSNPLVTVSNAPITIGKIVTVMFHSFSYSLARSRYLSFFSHSFSFILWSARTAMSSILQVILFVINRSGLLAIIIIIIIIINNIICFSRHL